MLVDPQEPSSIAFFKFAFINRDISSIEIFKDPRNISNNSPLFLLKKPISLNKKNYLELSHEKNLIKMDENEKKSQLKRLYAWINLPFHPNIMKPFEIKPPASIIVENFDSITLRG